MSGSNDSPDAVGVAPRTYCRNSGRKTVAPNMAKPTMKLIAETTAKVRFANRWRGSTGSAARRSTSAQTTVRTTPRTPSPMIWEDPQA